MQLNQNFNNIKESYLFTEVAERTNKYAAAHPDKKIIRLGLGDVCHPLAPAVIRAMHGAVDEMSKSETFKGYGPRRSLTSPSPTTSRWRRWTSSSPRLRS